MQFHLNGFRTGDPELSERAPAVVEHAGQDSLPSECDVLIVGCGPAGLTLAAQLAGFPDIRTCIVDQKSGPLELGQADGVACRTMEMFNAFGFAERVAKEACWVTETTFWKPANSVPARIERGGWIKDTEEGLSEFPHVILNQARVHEFYLDVMRKSPSRLSPYYGRRLLDLQIDQAVAPRRSASEYPVTATFESAEGSGRVNRVETVKARYVVGCDGARSAVRRSIGRELKGDSANHAWGVMDVLAVTDFPDIRFKCIINSADEGSIVIIPREGGYLVRIYVEVDHLHGEERVANRNLTLDDVIAAAQRILRPYTLDVKEVAWWSVYQIGQRLCDRFDDVPEAEREWRNPHVFIAGDACHTHSPKAGQGMNVSMQDSFNLGWKLASVLRGRCPVELLRTYSAERRAIAKELIDFDREWTGILATPVKSPSDPHGEGVEPAQIQDYFARHGRYLAGTATHYAPSILTGESLYQNLAQGFVIGKRFHSAPVIRVSDAKPLHLGHVNKADGRWRLFAFSDADGSGNASSKIGALCAFLANSPSSPVVRYTLKGEDVDTVIDVRAVFQERHRELRLEDMPDLLLPRKGRYGLKDYEKVFCADQTPGQDIFQMRGVDRAAGCIVIVRPDQYVAHVLPLDGYDELGAFFEPFMRPVGLSAAARQIIS
jgi:phenol 2-monooxygenase